MPNEGRLAEAHHEFRGGPPLGHAGGTEPLGLFCFPFLLAVEFLAQVLQRQRGCGVPQGVRTGQRATPPPGRAALPTRRDQPVEAPHPHPEHQQHTAHRPHRRDAGLGPAVPHPGRSLVQAKDTPPIPQQAGENLTPSS